MARASGDDGGAARAPNRPLEAALAQGEEMLARSHGRRQRRRRLAAAVGDEQRRLRCRLLKPLQPALRAMIVRCLAAVVDQ